MTDKIQPDRFFQRFKSSFELRVHFADRCCLAVLTVLAKHVMFRTHISRLSCRKLHCHPLPRAPKCGDFCVGECPELCFWIRLDNAFAGLAIANLLVETLNILESADGANC